MSNHLYLIPTQFMDTFQTVKTVVGKTELYVSSINMKLNLCDYFNTFTMRSFWNSNSFALKSLYIHVYLLVDCHDTFVS